MNVRPPAGFDAAHWIERWDAMQERYNVDRSRRFEIIVQVLRLINNRPLEILDLGCGTGSLSVRLLESFPSCRVTAVDMDPAMLVLARERLAPHGPRARILELDLRHDEWRDRLGCEASAAVSSTALHWMKPDDLAAFYGRLAKLLRPGGVFLDADHVSSPEERVQRAWDHKREMALFRRGVADADDWSGFWEAYGAALGIDPLKLRKDRMGDFEGVEKGMPLMWRFERLREAGFRNVDCYWRRDGDAVYGATL
jgi:SAM-dependent methyltransferase